MVLSVISAISSLNGIDTRVFSGTHLENYMTIT